MSMGAQRAEAQPEDGIVETGRHDWIGLPQTNHEAEPGGWAYEEPQERPLKARIVGVLLILLALAWTAAAVWSIWRGGPELSLQNALQWISFASPPLLLLGIAWMILGQTPRRETERFTRAVAAMRSESSALETVLTAVATRIEDNHERLRNEAAKLMSLGDEAADRLGRVAHYLSKESANLDKRSEQLESAAGNARVDIGVLLTDLPRAEEQARAVAEAMKEAGLTAHTQAGALEGQLSALVARGREADEVVGGAAQRLGAHLARVESTTTTASTRMEEAAASMSATIDETMARASDAIDSTRSSLDAQSAALLATISQHRASLEHAGEESARNLGQRLEAIGARIEALAGQLAAQDAASHALLSRVSQELTDLDQQFVALRDSGVGGAGQLEESFGGVRSLSQALFEELSGGQQRARELTERAQEMAHVLNGVTAQLNEDVTQALERVEEQADRTWNAASMVEPKVAAIESAAGGASAKLAEAEASIARQQETLETTARGAVAELVRQLTEVEARFAAVRETGGTSASEVGAGIAAMHQSLRDFAEALSGGEERASDLAARARSMGESLTQLSSEIEDRLPTALGRVEEQAERTRSAASSIVADISSVEASAAGAAARLAEAEASIARQQEALDASAQTIARDLARALADVEHRFASLRETGGSSTDQLAAAVQEVRTSVSELAGSFDGGHDRAADLAARARDINEALAALTSELDERIPAALTRVEEQAARTRRSTADMAPQMEAIRASAETAQARLAEAEASMARQEQALRALLGTLNEGVGNAEAQLRALSEAASEAEGAASRITADTGPELIGALLRVREAANQAASHARQAIAAVIPQSASAMADASRKAISDAVSGQVEAQLQELSAVAERALDTARKASERLTRQVLTIGETAAAVEARIDDARREREEKESDNFSRRVALLIESLNSTAIDVTKILSNEVTDSAWAAYLKGDRGVFTRRAVRLIDNAEAREIVQHYEAEPEFREQVNRYIHDFEAMLRRVLTERDSSALGVTILSSDMGKLYVALAQAIERLR